MKLLSKILFILLLVSFMAACQNHSDKKTSPEKNIKIGIIIPLEHKALRAIVAGFSEKLRTLYNAPVEIKVMNAEGDPNIMRAILQQMRDANYSMIVPVGTSATEMAESMIHNTPIVSLAADFSEDARHKLNPCNIVCVHDEISSYKLLEFLHTAHPELKHLVLIHSAEDKVLPDVQKTVKAGFQVGIEVKPIMVATLPELVAALQSLPDNTQGIFILKDNLIASGAPTIAKMAADKHIPFYTSDQGSVQSGAGFALGVREKQIGEEGAKLAMAVLMDDSISTLSNVEMNKLTVFVNKNALQLEQQNLTGIQDAAKKLNYNVEYVGDAA